MFDFINAILNLIFSIDGATLYWHFIAYFQEFIITILLVPIVVFFARKYHLLYKPNVRSSHSDPIPAFGGIAIFIGFIFSYKLVNDINQKESTILIIAFSLIFLVGFIDDLISVRAWRKMLIFILIAILVIQSPELCVNDLHGFLGIHHINRSASTIITILTIVYIINAINLIDGIDGLASGLGIIILSIFSIYFYTSNHTKSLSLTLPMIVALSAFLLYNLWGKRFKIFMGDCGSLLLGLVIAISLIRFLHIDSKYVNEPLWISPVSVFALLIVPAFDLFHVFIKRSLILKHSPFHPDKQHIHHTYLKLGFSHIQTSSILIGYTICFFLLSQFLLNYLSGYIVLLIIILLAFLLWNYQEFKIIRNPRKFVAIREKAKLHSIVVHNIKSYAKNL